MNHVSLPTGYRGPYVQVFVDIDNRWRWRSKAGNHRTTSTSGEDFGKGARGRWRAKRAARKQYPDLPLIVLTTPHNVVEK